MRSALYYPHTKIRSEPLLKSSLLLWDRLEYIVPYPEYKPDYQKRDVAEAIELIGHPHFPTAQEKHEVHQRIEDFVTGPLPAAFFYQPSQPEQHEYAIYPEKLLPETWDLLREVQLANRPTGHGRQSLVEGAALSVMSLLADCCAGKTRARVTDRSLAYANITNLSIQAEQPADENYDVVVPVTMKLINTEDLPLGTLVEFRKREAKAAGHEMRDLRHRYVKRIEDHISGIRQHEKKTDRQELQRQFDQEMEDDLKDLRSELGRNTNIALTSQEVMFAFVSTVLGVAGLLAGSLVVPAVSTAGVVVNVGGILRTHSKFAAKRKGIMREHPMAYMYQLEQFAPYHA